MSAAEFTIGQIAQQTGCKIPTIRYYEQIGLLPAPRRSPGNQRIYGASHLERLTFIRRCRDLGFSQPAIRELLRLSEHPNMPCGTVTEIARERLEEVERRIAQLSSLKSELDSIINGCQENRMKNCRIIEALAHEKPSGAH